LYIDCKTRSTLDYETTLDPELVKKKTGSLAMQISKANNTEIIECNFLMSCRPFVRDYLDLLKQLNTMRLQDPAIDSGLLVVILLKVNREYKNLVECVSILTQYSENQLMSENSRFNKELIKNRKKVGLI
jgi:hypothetical protein